MTATDIGGSFIEGLVRTLQGKTGSPVRALDRGNSFGAPHDFRFALHDFPEGSPLTMISDTIHEDYSRGGFSLKPLQGNSSHYYSAFIHRKGQRGMKGLYETLVMTRERDRVLVTISPFL